MRVWDPSFLKQVEPPRHGKARRSEAGLNKGNGVRTQAFRPDANAALKVRDD
jgi:hypothetical protein